HFSPTAEGPCGAVVLRGDGGIKCGTDVLVAAAMGADEFGFGSLAMIATGCIMARICHTNNCPVGVASQHDEFGPPCTYPSPFPLPSVFPHQFPASWPPPLLTRPPPPFETHLSPPRALQVRVGLASLGMKSLDELVGRVNALKARDVALAKTNSIDLSYLLTVSCPSPLHAHRPPLHTLSAMHAAPCPPSHHGPVSSTCACMHACHWFPMSSLLCYIAMYIACAYRIHYSSILTNNINTGPPSSRPTSPPCHGAPPYPGVSSASSTERMAQEVHSNGPMLDDTLLANPTVMAAIEQNKVVQLATPIVNTDRSTCGRVAGAIAKRHGDSGFTGAVNITAGQSFGCFLAGGMNIRLIGEANDYVGKIVVVPSKAATFQAETATIIGNTCLYGATGGRLFVRGCAGERFAVRNSNAQAVLEGAGDHCCEYMTGGTVVALGKVGRNVAAGMTEGIGYFLDVDDTFSPKVRISTAFIFLTLLYLAGYIDVIPQVNREIVAMQRVVSPGGQQQLKSLIQDHADLTGSAKAAAILADWDKFLPLFWQLVPPSEANSPEAKAPAAEEPVAALA
ncbi:unnamed protein product, partial [Closterium sp. NIES-64]